MIGGAVAGQLGEGPRREGEERLRRPLGDLAEDPAQGSKGCVEDPLVGAEEGDERVDPIGRLAVGLEDHLRAHREAAERGAVDPRVVEDPQEVVAEGRHRHALGGACGL